MSNSITKQNFEEALLKMARSLSSEQWQAMVVVKGINSLLTREKVKIVKEMINAAVPKREHNPFPRPRKPPSLLSARDAF